MNRAGFAAALIGISWLLAAPVSADIAFPARLDVAEREPGIFDIVFTLPILEGRTLRAQPLMPPSCRNITSRVDGASTGGLTSTWSVQCEPASLAGEAIIVEGLLGTQTDLAFTLTMLDGRTYSEILRPSRPGFLVPEPPTLAGLAVESIGGGMRRTLRHVNLWILFAAAALLGARTRTLAVAAGAFAVGHFVAQWLGGHDWLLVSPLIRDAFTWAAAAAGAVRLACAGAGWKGWLQPPWATTLLLGLLFGGARAEALATDGLSNTEQFEVLILFAIGAAAAVLLMTAAAGQLHAAINTAGGSRKQEIATQAFGYIAGACAIGMVLVQVVGLMVSSGSGQRAFLQPALFAAVLGSTTALAGWRKVQTVPPFVVLAVIGATLGLLGVPFPTSRLLALGALLVLATTLAVNRPLPTRWVIPVGIVATPALAWSTARDLVENVSRSTAVTGGTVLVAICVLSASLSMTRTLKTEGFEMPIRLMAAAVAILAVGWRLGEYRTWFEREVATEAALGLTRIPLLALSLVVLAALLWPRRRRVARELGLEQRSRSLHWFLLGAAFLLLPFGTVAVQNPFFEPRAPRGDDARLVVSRVLSDTYHAFNIADEDSLYATLTESVTGDLVDDLFLDSRRRLTAGTRDGTEVTVRDVSVLSIGEPLNRSVADEGFSYDCRWEVIARVRHLQHIHHRQNIYTGVLTLQPENGRWKIAHVDLTSEDRAVVAWKPS